LGTGGLRCAYRGAGGDGGNQGRKLSHCAAKNLGNLTGGYGIRSRESQSPCGFPGDEEVMLANGCGAGTAPALQKRILPEPGQ